MRARKTRLFVCIRGRTLAAIVALAVVAALAGANASLVMLRDPIESLVGRVVVVDPGHGGIDGGTVFGDVLEKNVNLAVGMELKGVLEQSGAVVYMTRQEDVSLERLGPPLRSRHRRDLIARTSIASWVNGEVLLSIHMNSSRSTSARGPTVFYRKGSDGSQTLSELVLQELEKVMGPSRDGSLGRQYYVTENVAMPAVLIEVGFVTNPSDRSRMVEPLYQKEIAAAIARGLGRYLRDNPGGAESSLVPWRHRSVPVKALVD